MRLKPPFLLRADGGALNLYAAQRGKKMLATKIPIYAAGGW